MDGLWVHTYLSIFPSPSNTSLNNFPMVSPRGWLGTNPASVGYNSSKDHSSGKSTAASLVYTYATALVGGPY